MIEFLYVKKWANREMSKNTRPKIIKKHKFYIFKT